MKRWLAFLLLGIPAVSHGRAESAQPTTGFTLRALVIPYALGNAGGMYYTGGVEYIFQSKHGIGLDYSYNDYNNPDDPYPGSGAIAPRLYAVSRGLVLSYRRYLPLHDGQRNRYRPYLSAFVRYGNRSFHPEPGYQPKDRSLENRVKFDEQQYSVGLVGGLITGYRFGRINLDIGAGPFLKLKTAQDQRVEAGGIYTYHMSSANAGVRLVLTVSYLRAFPQPLRRRR